MSARYRFLINHILKYKYQFIIPILCMIGLAIITPLTFYIGTKLIMDEVLELHTIKPYFIDPQYANYSHSLLFNIEYWQTVPKIYFNKIFEGYMGHQWYAIFSYIVVPLFLIKALLMYARQWRVNYIGQQIICDFQTELYEHFLKLPIPFFNKTRSGEVTSSIISDVYRIQEIVTDGILQSVQNTLIIVCTVTVLICISPSLTIIALIGMPIAILPIVITARYLKKKSKTSQEEIANISSHIYETVSAIKIIKIFNTEKLESNRFQNVLKKLLKVLYKSAKVGAISPPLVEFISIFYLSLFVAYGCSLVESGAFAKGSFIAFIVLVFSLYEPVKKLSRLNNKLANCNAAIDRIMVTLAIKGENYNNENAKELKNIQKGISFHNITFAYEENKIILENVSFEVPKGKTTALVGLSGSGKTTLINLLPCFYEINEGDIKIDGESIKNYTLASIRKHISLVSQDIVLFNETVSFNISYGSNNITEEQIIAAAKKANAHEFIMQLPLGYQTIIGERGTRLSGGQKQRLSIARAILANAPILILDEATSSLDVQSEKLIHHALEELMKDKTSIAIAHRLTTIKNADQIIVLDKGKVQDIGKHEMLMQKGGLYKNLYDTFITE